MIGVVQTIYVCFCVFVSDTSAERKTNFKIIVMYLLTAVDRGPGIFINNLSGFVLCFLLVLLLYQVNVVCVLAMKSNFISHFNAKTAASFQLK